MATVRDLLRAKGDSVWFVTPKTSIVDALKYLAEKDIGALLVLDGERLAGIISERDFVRMIAETGVCSTQTTVQEYMTSKVVTVKPEQTEEDCMRLMTDKRVRHLPVQEGDKIIGVISIGDVVKDIINRQGKTIEQLENFIGGRGYGQ